MNVGNPRSGQSMFQSQVGGFTPTPASRGFSESYHTNLTPARNNPTGFTTASVSVCSPVNVIPCSTPNRTVLTRHANPDSLREDHHVNGGQQIARHKPAAPLPSRKHRTKSPPIVSTNTTGYWLPGERLAHVSSFDPRVVVQSPSEVTNTGVPKSQRSFRVDDSDHMYGQNSADNNDLSVSVGPRRPCALSDYSPTDTTALGSPTITTYHNLRDLTVSQATVVLAPENSTTSGGVVAASNEPRDMHHTRCSSGTQAPSTTDSSSRMTVSELRSVAERQRQQLMRQAQQIQAKEERLAWLRSLHTSCAVSGSTGLAQTPASGSELTHEQEVLLHKLRGFRGQTEHTRLTNETIVKEIDNLSRSLSSKEVELTAYLQRSDAARQLLPILSACHLCLSGNSSGRAHRIYAPSSDDCVNLEKPLDLLSFHLPFSSDRDKKHWRDGLLEADRLDKQIALALNHNAASQMKRAMTTSEELKNSDRPVSNAHMTFNARKPALVEFNQSVVHNKYPTVSKSNDDPASMSSKPPFVSSDFSSLLSRASSPPASRRSLRMLLHAANLGGISSVATSHTTPTSSGIVSSTLPRIKTPPRYASRAVINDTYMRRICRDSVEKYKRTASEIYRANMERLSAKQTSSLATSEPNSESHRPEEVDTDVVVVQPCHEPSELRVSPTNFAHLTLRQPITSSLQSASFDPASSSSSSSLELLGIDESSVCPGQLDEPVVRDKTDSKLTAAGSGDLDSGIGASDDTTPSEHANITGLCTSHPNTALASATVVFVDDGPGTDGCLSNASVDGTSQRVQSILRKAVKHSTSEMASTTATELTNDQPSTLNSSSQSRSNSVRFHPLALLLDAALEGDLDLVKKMAAAVTDVSEPNDEGITALHNAVCAGRTDIADFLVRTAGADVNAGDTDGWTPLHCAASCANLTLARLLVEHGASLHARTLSDHETPLEKCDQGDDEAECEEYLFFQQERLGSAASGRVYALFPRGLEAAGAGSADAYIQADELPIYPNEPLTIVDREPAGEPEWMMAEKADGTHGLVPRSHISCYPLVRVPPASHPIPILPPVATRFEIWDDDEEDDTSSPVAEEPADTQASGDDTIPLVIEVDVSVADLPVSSGHTLPVVTRPTCSTTVMLRNDQLPAQSENIEKRLVTPTPTPRDGNNCDLKTAL
ncbi:unnamed protein product [Dicrocoelium dendriticum]|nr:unnamed protein product [Dicrocoelium dendriticum]